MKSSCKELAAPRAPSQCVECAASAHRNVCGWRERLDCAVDLPTRHSRRYQVQLRWPARRGVSGRTTVHPRRAAAAFTNPLPSVRAAADDPAVRRCEDGLSFALSIEERDDAVFKADATSPNEVLRRRALGSSGVRRRRDHSTVVSEGQRGDGRRARRGRRSSRCGVRCAPPPAARPPRARARRRARWPKSPTEGPAEGSGDGPKLCAPPSAILTGMLQANGSPRARPLTPHLNPPTPAGARRPPRRRRRRRRRDRAPRAPRAPRHLLGLGLRLAVLELYMMNLN